MDKATRPASLAPAGVTPTNSWVNLYASNLTLDGEIVHGGADISAYTLDGRKIGGDFTSANGHFGFMPVYADAVSTGSESGMKPGETFYLTVDGAETNERFVWSNNGDRIEVTTLTAKGTSEIPLPDDYSLAQNYPNPFNPSTNISFSVPADQQARIEIYNVLGKLVAVPFDGRATAGENVVEWNGMTSSGQKVSSGVYLYRLVTDNYVETRKMMLLK
jgi:hypothetical protein